MRVEQPPGKRGSLKWIQRAVDERWASLEQPILAELPSGTRLEWLSPLAIDGYAEYRDAPFLRRIGHPELEGDLRAFWPARGPQWDALARGTAGDVLLVEAKAHVAELCSPGTSAGPSSRALIAATLNAVAEHLGARPDRADWTRHFYQLANRLAHLEFLRARGVQAWLVLVNFVGDSEMGGPSGPEAWNSAYDVALYVMGLSRRHALSKYVIHVAPSVV